MTLKEMYSFIYPDEAFREKLISTYLTEVEIITENRVLLHLGMEKDKKIADFEKEMRSGYYVYFSYAHYDDELFIWHPDLESASQQYENEDIHEQYSFTMEKRLLLVSDKSIEQLKMDKWKEHE